MISICCFVIIKLVIIILCFFFIHSIKLSFSNKDNRLVDSQVNDTYNIMMDLGKLVIVEVQRGRCCRRAPQLIFLCISSMLGRSYFPENPASIPTMVCIYGPLLTREILGKPKTSGKDFLWSKIIFNRCLIPFLLLVVCEGHNLELQQPLVSSGKN